LLVLCHHAVLAQRGPVTITASPSTENMKTGDVITETIRVTARTDLGRLELTLTPLEGIEIVSGNTTAVFDSTKSGETRDLEIRVRLTGAKYGELSVFCRAVVGDQTQSAGLGITFGSTKH
jgi:hypothetical protein